MSLIFYVLPDNIYRSAAGGNEAIGSGPKNGLQVEFGEMVMKFLPYQAAGDGLEIIDEPAWHHGWMQGQEQVGVIGFPSELEEVRVPVSAHLPADFFHTGKNFR
jgi:hypothetical protein